MRHMKLYFRYLGMHMASGLQYKGWWLMCIQVLVVVLTDILGTVFLFMRFGGVGAWSLERIVLVYALALCAFGLAESLCRGFDYFPWRMIRSGEFDRVLLRPCPLFLQIAASYFHIHRMVRAGTALAMIFWALGRMGISLGAGGILILTGALMGGTLLYAGVFVLTSGVAFFTIKALDWIYIFTNASYQVARIPMTYMPGVLRHVFTFLMPMLVVSYYPASALCGWGDPVFLGYLALPAGFLFLMVSLWVFRFGVGRYQSTGS